MTDTATLRPLPKVGDRALFVGVIYDVAQVFASERRVLLDSRIGERHVLWDDPRIQPVERPVTGWSVGR